MSKKKYKIARVQILLITALWVPRAQQHDYITFDSRTLLPPPSHTPKNQSEFPLDLLAARTDLLFHVVILMLHPLSGTILGLAPIAAGQNTEYLD